MFLACLYGKTFPFHSGTNVLFCLTACLCIHPRWVKELVRQELCLSILVLVPWEWELCWLKKYCILKKAAATDGEKLLHWRERNTEDPLIFQDVLQNMQRNTIWDVRPTSLCFCCNVSTSGWNCNIPKQKVQFWQYMLYPWQECQVSHFISMQLHLCHW